MKIVPKILVSILTKRLQHLFTDYHILGAPQIGFAPLHGAEMHVFTLLETIKQQLRLKRSVHVLYLDLRKAFDSISQEGLWKLLENVGVHVAVIDFLRNWADSTHARVAVNGYLTEEFRIRCGVAQGNPLSPLLFNLFIECLSRYIAAETTGVAMLDVVVKSLLYADDVACIAPTRSELQTAANVIDHWCNAFGMQIGIGGGKTEVSDFPPSRAPGPSVRAGSEDAVTVMQGDDPVALPTTNIYKYLGLMLQNDLAFDAHFKRFLQRARFNFHRYFARNMVTRRTSAFNQFEILRTAVIGSINYLRAVVHLNRQQRSTVNTFTLYAALRILGLSEGCSNGLV